MLYTRTAHGIIFKIIFVSSPDSFFGHECLLSNSHLVVQYSINNPAADINKAKGNIGV